MRRSCDDVPRIKTWGCISLKNTLNLIEKNLDNYSVTTFKTLISLSSLRVGCLSSDGFIFI